MRVPRIGPSFLLAFAVLLCGLPLGGIEAPAAPTGQAGGAAGPIDFAAVWDATGVSDASRKAPDLSSVAAMGFAALSMGPGSARGTERRGVAPGVPTPLYLSHCAFLC